MNKILFILIAGIFISEVSAQDVLFPLSRDMNTRIESFINADTTGFHSSVKPYLIPELRKAVPVDSIFSPIVKDGKFTRTWVGRKLFKEHLLFVDEDDIVLSVVKLKNCSLVISNFVLYKFFPKINNARNSPNFLVCWEVSRDKHLKQFESLSLFTS